MSIWRWSRIWLTTCHIKWCTYTCRDFRHFCFLPNRHKTFISYIFSTESFSYTAMQRGSCHKLNMRNKVLYVKHLPNSDWYLQTYLQVYIVIQPHKSSMVSCRWLTVSLVVSQNTKPLGKADTPGWKWFKDYVLIGCGVVNIFNQSGLYLWTDGPITIAWVLNQSFGGHIYYVDDV